MSEDSIGDAILKGLQAAKREILRNEEGERRQAAVQAENDRASERMLQKAFEAAEGMVQVMERLRALPGSGVQFSVSSANPQPHGAVVKITTNIPILSLSSGRQEKMQLAITSSGDVGIMNDNGGDGPVAKADKPDDVVTFVVKRAAVAGLLPAPK